MQPKQTRLSQIVHAVHRPSSKPLRSRLLFAPCCNSRSFSILICFRGSKRSSRLRPPLFSPPRRGRWKRGICLERLEPLERLEQSSVSVHDLLHMLFTPTAQHRRPGAASAVVVSSIKSVASCHALQNDSRFEIIDCGFAIAFHFRQGPATERHRVPAETVVGRWDWDIGLGQHSHKPILDR